MANLFRTLLRLLLENLSDDVGATRALVFGVLVTTKSTKRFFTHVEIKLERFKVFVSFECNALALSFVLVEIKPVHFKYSKLPLTDQEGYRVTQVRNIQPPP